VFLFWGSLRSLVLVLMFIEFFLGVLGVELVVFVGWC